jgi:hypothetical protein
MFPVFKTKSIICLSDQISYGVCVLQHALHLQGMDPPKLVEKCTGITKKGNRCKRYPETGTDRCFQHKREDLTAADDIVDKEKDVKIILPPNVHSRKEPSLLCIGVTSKGSPCKKSPRQGTPFCCSQHDVKSLGGTKLLRISKLHELRVEDVQKYRGGKDIYTGEYLGMGGLGAEAIDHSQFQLDHVVELHSVRDCLDAIPVFGSQFTLNKKNLADFLKNDVVNDKQNLGYTAKDVNTFKFNSIRAFCKDFKYGTVDGDLVHYLNEGIEHKKGRNKWRKITTAIQKEIVLSYDFTVDQLQPENILHQEMIEQMHALYITGMKIN